MLEALHSPHLHLPETTVWQPRFLTACNLASQTDLATGCMISPGSGIPTVGVLRFDAPPLIVDTSKGTLHWSPAIWQSVEFLAVEHTFRLASDPYARYLLIHKPFWQDYFASANHFDMYRWGDGDDFLVNYIGHPLQGSVSGDIFLQNDPRGRSARFGRSPDYWHSRLQAMAWAGAYSAYFEIGPVLSEAAIGNEGGYTYVPTCGFYPCQEKPGVHYKPATNNTGWVDFVITPVVGTGWIVMEDAIEREFVDRVAKRQPGNGVQNFARIAGTESHLLKLIGGEISLESISGERLFDGGRRRIPGGANRSAGMEILPPLENGFPNDERRVAGEQQELSIVPGSSHRRWI